MRATGCHRLAADRHSRRNRRRHGPRGDEARGCEDFGPAHRPAAVLSLELTGLIFKDEDRAARRREPRLPLEFAVSLINRVVAGVDGLRIGLHVCRGNWSRDETTLLSGGYQALRTCFDRLHITQLVLEYATERAGTLVGFEGKELGLGVVNPRTDQVETPEQIRAAVEEALRLYPAERVFLNPDCGFGTFSNRPMNTLEIASAKVAAMAAAARDLRGRS
jgi:5-methyltetrahydropteroyltriglutamate--homocysteine methyltransferase